MSKTRNPDALIRIEDAIKVLCREKCHPGVLCPDNYCAEMWDEFEDAERVDAVPARHGRWINGKCDKCGGHAPFWAMATTYYPSKFCPDCGARMDGKDGEGCE